MTKVKSWKNIINQLTKLSKIDFLCGMNYITLFAVSSTTDKTWPLVGRMWTCHQFQIFQGFTKISVKFTN